jgi:hypothetical protein
LWEKGWLASVYSFEVWFFSQLNLLVVMPEWNAVNWKVVALPLSF